jgi:hypothetical protein
MIYPFDSKAKPTPALDEIYYNTVKYSGEELQTRLLRAKNQDQAVLLWMANHPDDDFTRDEVYKLVMPRAKESSVGRSLNTLMEAGYLNKLDIFRMGDAGSRQHRWQLKRQPNRKPEQERLF